MLLKISNHLVLFFFEQKSSGWNFLPTSSAPNSNSFRINDDERKRMIEQEQQRMIRSDLREREKMTGLPAFTPYAHSLQVQILIQYCVYSLKWNSFRNISVGFIKKFTIYATILLDNLIFSLLYFLLVVRISCYLWKHLAVRNFNMWSRFIAGCLWTICDFIFVSKILFLAFSSIVNNRQCKICFLPKIRCWKRIPMLFYYLSEFEPSNERLFVSNSSLGILEEMEIFTILQRTCKTRVFMWHVTPFCSRP